MHDRRPLVTVIMPVFNGEQYIEEAIWSVLKQPEKDLVLIVINDGSKDNTQELIERIAINDDRLIIIQQENSGVSVARNKGIAKSLEIGARYLAFLDSDDVWCKDFFCKKTKELLESEEYDLIGFDYYTGARDLLRGRRHRALDTQPKGVYPFRNHFSSFIYNTRVLKNTRVCFPDRIKIFEDVAYLMLFNYFSEYYICVHESAFIYRNNPVSVTKSQDILGTFFDSYIPVWNWIARALDNDKCVIETCNSMKRLCLIEFIQQSCIQGKKLIWIRNRINESTDANILYDDSVYINEKYKEVLLFYMRYPKTFWIKNRLLGLFSSFRRLLKRIRILYRYYYFKESIEVLHY